mgnify:FL=1
MYFSDHNDKITFINEWCGTLRVEGKGLVCAEDLNASPGRFNPEEYTELEFTKGTHLKPTIKEIAIILHSTIWLSLLWTNQSHGPFVAQWFSSYYGIIG